METIPRFCRDDYETTDHMVIYHEPKVVPKSTQFPELPRADRHMKTIYPIKGYECLKCHKITKPD